MRATDPVTRRKVIDLYLQGVGRNENARLNDIGEATVTDLINAWKRGTENPNLDEYEAVRQLAIHCRKEGFGSITDFRHALRIKSYLERLGLDVRDNEESVENFIANLAIQPDPAKFIEVAGRIASSSSNSNSDLPLEKLEEQINAKRAENDTLEAQKEALLTEIEEGRKALDADRKAAEDFLVVKEEMEKCGIGSDSRRFLDMLHTFQRFNFDCNKMVNTFIEVQDIIQTINY